ncbi:MAG: hypothetical protein ABIP41_03195 [Croceibacterium sp.]
MTIRFAARAGAFAPRLDCFQVGAPRVRPANDNDIGAASDALLGAALRHFAEHGLAAATRARSEAEAAFFAGNRPAYQWWLEICRALDRGMAREVEHTGHDRGCGAGTAN